MDDSRTKRGYALTGLMCIGTLACGPDGPGSQDGGETTGYPMTGTTGTESGSTSGTETGTETETETETGTDPDPSDCSYRGDICGEYSVCQCSCDYSEDCCYCDSADCTQDSHCPEGQICQVWVESHWTHAECLPASCDSPAYIYLQGPDADPSEFADAICAWNLSVSGTPLTDLSALANLEHVLGYVRVDQNADLISLDGPAIKTAGALNISYNDGLTSVDALTSLEFVGGGQIYCNGQLPEADVDAALAQIPNGDQIGNSQNGQGPC